MDDDTRLDETPDEREIAEDTGATPDEAHRIGEYDELRGLIEGVMSEVAGVEGMRDELRDLIEGVMSEVADVRRLVEGMRDALTTFQAVQVDDGAEVSDADADGINDDEDERPIIPDFDDLDLSFR